MTNPKLTNIKSWAEDDRPREKLLLKGKESLSDAELVAIIIGSGSKEETAVDLAKKILASVSNNLQQLGKLTLSDLIKFKGIGEAKAISILTALEIGRRRRLYEATSKRSITSSKDVFNIMQPVIGELSHEEFWILFLNNSNKVIEKKQFSVGGLTATVVDARIILKRALEVFATQLILCHNHPSGKLEPSNADKQLTTKIKEAAKTLDINVLDHIIVTENAYFSFADENVL